MLRSLVEKLKGSRLMRDSLWAVTGSGLGKGLSFLAGIYIARLLGSNIYGEYGMIKSTLLNISVLSTFGLGYTATKHVAEACREDKGRIPELHFIIHTITLTISGAMALSLLCFSNEVAAYLDAPSLAPSLRITALAVVFNAINAAQIGELGGFGAYRQLAFNALWTGVFDFVVCVTLTVLWGLEGAVYAMCLAYMFNCFLNRLSYHKVSGKSKRWNLPSLQRFLPILRFSFPIALQECLYSVSSWAMMLLIVKMTNYTQLGIYSAAMIWYSIILFIPGALRNVALSHLSTTNSDGGENHATMRQLLKINFVTTLFPAVVIAGLSPLALYWYGPSYSGLAWVMVALAVNSLVVAYSYVFTQELIAYGRNWAALVMLGSCYATNLVMAYAFIYNFGNAALSCAVAMIIGQAVYAIAISWYYKMAVAKLSAT